MTVLEKPRSIEAMVPYLRSDLTFLHVEFEKRELGEEMLERHRLEIRNGRAEPKPSLEVEGLTIATFPSKVIRERMAEITAVVPMFEKPQVFRDYGQEMLPLIQKLTGAREVIAMQSSGVRYSPRAGKKRMTPAVWAHIDYDKDEIEVQLKDTLDYYGKPVKPFSRYVLCQGWRPLSAPPQDFPLALCDGRTVRTEDIIPMDYHMISGDKEVTYRTRGARYSPRHKWWYFPDMTPDEMIVFKGYDSANPDGMRTLHVAFEDTTAVDPVPRSSVESRYFALFD
jgi:hypothetical protein